MNSKDLDFRQHTQIQFEKLLKSSFSFLQPVDKWKQVMWHNEGDLIVSLVFLSKNIKFCFFNNPDIELDKLQRWGSTVYSQNLELKNDETVDWERIGELITNTIEVRSKNI